MNVYSIRFFRNGKWDKRGIRATAYTQKEAIAIARERKHIPQDEKVLVSWHYVHINNSYDFN